MDKQPTNHRTIEAIGRKKNQMRFQTWLTTCVNTVVLVAIAGYTHGLTTHLAHTLAQRLLRI